MCTQIQIFLNNWQFQMSLNSECFRDSLREVTESGSKDLGTTTLNFSKNSASAELDFLNNRSNLVYNMKEVNLSCGLTQVPKVLFDLKYLTILNLSNNCLESLPNEIGNLCNLMVLKLSGNQLNYLPKSLKHIQQLNYLDISRNNFSEVPDVLYYGARALKVLDLSYNKIAVFSDFPGCLNKLVVLKLSNNLLKQVPAWVFHSLCQLQFLYLGENLLNFETEFVNYCSSGIFESLQLLNIENCNLSHEGIQILSLFKNLNVIQIGNKTCTNDNSKGKNYMGNLKSDSFKNCKKLKSLCLKNTQIATLPSDFDCLKSIEVLDLSDNILSWLPECFCNLINLRILNLTSNQLLFLPESIDKLISLRQIHLGNNKLYQIPESFSNLKNLEFVDLYNNQIERIDPDIFKGNQLKGIDLGLNCLHFDFHEFSVDDEEIWTLYNSKKDSFRNHFSNVTSRSDLQKTKLDGNYYEKNCDSHSCIGSFESESLSDLEDLSMNIDLSIDLKAYDEDENWEEKHLSQSEEDELFDPNEHVKFERRCNFRNSDFRNNYCPAKSHLPSSVKTYVRKCASSSKNETVEDGQFDSD